MAYKPITVKELYNLIQTNNYGLIIDVRSAEEFKNIRIPNSINIPLPILSCDEVLRLLTLKKVSLNTPLYLTCAVGPRAIQACKLLEEKFENVYHLVGCLNAWVNTNFPTHTGKL